MKHQHLHRQVTWKNGTNTIARPKICKAREKNLFLILQLVKTSIWRRQKLKPTRRFIKTRNNNAGKKEKREQSSMLTKPIRTGKFSFHSAAEKEREREKLSEEFFQLEILHRSACEHFPSLQFSWCWVCDQERSPCCVECRSVNCVWKNKTKKSFKHRL